MKQKTTSMLLLLAAAAASVWNITKVMPGISLSHLGLGAIALIILTMAAAFILLMNVNTSSFGAPAMMLWTVVWMLWAFPIIRLIIFVCLMMFTGLKMDSLAQTRWEWIGIAVVYGIILLVFIRILISAIRGFVPKTRKCVGPDGNTYLLPTDKKTGYYIYCGKSDKITIKNELHRLLWVSEFLEIVYQSKNFTAEGEHIYTSRWMEVAKTWEGKSSGVNGTLIQCPRKYVDMKKAVHFYEMAAEAAYQELHHHYLTYDASGVWSDYDLNQMQEICGRLIEIYRDGAPGVSPSGEKVKYYQDFFEKYKTEREKDIKTYKMRLREREEKEQQERDRAGFAAQSGEAYRSYSSSSEASFDPEPQTGFSFPVYLYDYDENPWELINSGYDNASYYCQKTGETKTFYQSDFDIGSPSGFHRR